MSYIIKEKGRESYFSTFLFPHWEGQLGPFVTRFKTKSKAQKMARQVGGEVIEKKEKEK